MLYAAGVYREIYGRGLTAMHKISYDFASHRIALVITAPFYRALKLDTIFVMDNRLI